MPAVAVIYVIIFIVFVVLLIKVIRDRLQNKEDEYYSKNVDK
jgi:cytochrome bd-type quinol oxidase subunit 1